MTFNLDGVALSCPLRVPCGHAGFVARSTLTLGYKEDLVGLVEVQDSAFDFFLFACFSRNDLVIPRIPAVRFSR